MLEMPKILFLSCLGSYFYSIIQERHNDDTNPLLYYLSGGRLQFVEKDIADVLRTKGNNPWRYQPVMLIRNNEEIQINDNFFAFIKTMFNVDVVKCNALEKIIEDVDKGVFCICKVDEFHIKKSVKYYMRSSNRHYLLIRRVNKEKSKFEVIDSEMNAFYDVGFGELKRAVCDNEFKHKVYYRVDCKNYRLKNSFCVKYDNVKIDSSFIAEMREGLSISVTEEQKYCFMGYRYNIISKIIPMFEWRKLFMELVGDEQKGAMVSALLKKWRNLNIFMLYKIQHADYDIEAVQKKLKEIENLCALEI